jgi:sulfite reductase alpha subunit-like flavoprotein
VQDALRERSPDVAELLKDPNTYVYVRGVRGIETGVLEAPRHAATSHARAWDALHAQLKQEGRLCIPVAC